MAAWYEPAAADASRLRWLDQTAEDALEPGLPIVDPHHHLWDARTPLSGAEHHRAYIDEEGREARGGLHVSPDRPGGGVDPAAYGLQLRYTHDDVVHEMRSCGHRIKSTVLVEAGSFFRAAGPVEMRCVGETEWAVGVAAMSRSGAYGSTAICAALVPTADLSLGAAAEPVLRAHLAASGGSVRAIRAPFAAVGEAKLGEAMALLARLGLAFEVTSTYELGEAIALAAAFPDVTLVLNHCGEGAGPQAFAGHPEREARWREQIVALAAHPNVVAKVGGCALCGYGFEERPVPVGSAEFAERLLPIYGHVIRSFGPRRCMAESNFPVEKKACSYNVLWNGLKRIAAELGLSADDKRELFAGTAERVYRLA